MPELPEVETVCQALKMVMPNQIIAKVWVNCHRLRYNLPIDLAEKLTGQKVLSITRRGKYILIHFKHFTWVVHLGMSGRILQGAVTYQQKKHDHVLWQVQDKIFAFNDPRRFGEMALLDNNQVNNYGLLKTMGPEPFEIKSLDFFQRLQKTHRPLKTALLDQTLIAGLGNIYVCEALWLSNLSPYKKANTLSLKAAEFLLKNIQKVLTNAIAAGGSSLRDYRQVNNERGYFQHHFNVYNQAEKNCKTSKCVGIVIKQVQAGRSTYFCPICQK